MKKTRSYIEGKRCSKGEKRISDILIENNINHQKEYTYKNCLSPKGNLLRFDFYLLDYNILIEYQGQHHYKPVNKYRRAKIVHDKTIINDNIKKEFVAVEGIKLLEIHHKDYDNLETIIKEIILCETSTQ